MGDPALPRHTLPLHTQKTFIIMGSSCSMSQAALQARKENKMKSMLAAQSQRRASAISAGSACSSQSSDSGVTREGELVMNENGEMVLKWIHEDGSVYSDDDECSMTKVIILCGDERRELFTRNKEVMKDSAGVSREICLAGAARMPEQARHIISV